MKKIIICGKSGSGKDFLLKKFIERGFKYSPKITTRPKRNGEKEGIDYHFVDNQIFIEMINCDEIISYQSFQIDKNTWYYGITRKNFLENSVFIMTPHEISTLSDLSNCYIIYLDIDREVRRTRIFKRNDNNDSITRRLEADDKDFSEFSSYNIKITNPNFKIDTIISLLN